MPTRRWWHGIRSLGKQLQSVLRSPENPCPCELLKIEAAERYGEQPEPGKIIKWIEIKADHEHPDTLTEAVIRHLQPNDKYSTPMAIRATAELRDMLSDRTGEYSMWVQLGSPNAREMNVQRYNQLLGLLAGSFFPGRMHFDFQFKPDEDEDYADTLYQLNEEGCPYGRIRLHPYRVEYPSGHEPDNLADVIYHRTVFRLGTLLHEICHAFQLIYMCLKCKKNEVKYVECNGHGWAWQRIAARVESMAQLKLGLPLDLGRFTAIHCHWKHHKTWPDVDEVLQWGLKDATTVRVEDLWV
jgi:hypothetical protein